MLCYRMWVTSVAILLLPPPSLMEDGEMNVWRGVLVSYTKLTGATKTQQESVLIPPGASPSLYCSSSCTRLSWCKLWCSHPSIAPTDCFFSNIIVMPTYQENNMFDALTCYTKLNKDHATNAAIKAGEYNPPSPDKPKENLVDGIFSYSMGENFATPPAIDKKWFVLEFSQIITFSRVILFPQLNDRASLHFVNVEVRVGNMTVTPPSGFSDYDFFGAFPSAASAGQVVNLQSPEPVSAKFLSVQMLENNGRPFQVAHIEIY